MPHLPPFFHETSLAPAENSYPGQRSLPGAVAPAYSGTGPWRKPQIGAPCPKALRVSPDPANVPPEDIYPEPDRGRRRPVGDRARVSFRDNLCRPFLRADRERLMRRTFSWGVFSP